MKLTNIKCQKTKATNKVLKLFDGKGLFLEIRPIGSKYWRMKYRFLGTEKVLAIGVYPEVNLAQARRVRDEARQLLRDGIDPSAHKKQRKQNQLEAEARRQQNTFEAAARAWHAHNVSGWTERHAAYVLRRLEGDVFPQIGGMPLEDIQPADIVAMLQNIEARGANELARRLKQTCGQIFRYAIIHGKTGHNPAEKFNAKDILKPYGKGHFAALDAKELPEFMRALELNEARLYPHTRLAMKLLVLTLQG